MTAAEPMLAMGCHAHFEGVVMRVVDACDKGVVLYANKTADGSDIRDGRTIFMPFDEIRVAIRQNKLIALGPDPTVHKSGLEPKHVSDLVARSMFDFDAKSTEEMARRRIYCQACDKLFLEHRGELGWAKRPKEGYARIATITAERIHSAKAKAMGKTEREVAFVGPPSGSTLRSWYQCWLSANRKDQALFPRHDDKGKSADRLPATIKTIIRDVLQNRYMVQERPSLAAVFDFVCKEIDQQKRLGKPSKIIAPDIEVMRRFISRTITGYELDMRRKGPQAAAANFKRGKPMPTEALQVVEIDHTPLDLFVVLQPGDYGYVENADPKKSRPYAQP